MKAIRSILRFIGEALADWASTPMVYDERTPEDRSHR